ncbi:hypothetical protein NPIL_166991, partial [Nephila pilipes]
LNSGGLFPRRPVLCGPLIPAHQKTRFREHQNWTANEWGQVLKMREV